MFPGSQGNMWRDLVATFEPSGIERQRHAAMVLPEDGARRSLDVLARVLVTGSPDLVARVEDLAWRGLVTRERSAKDR